LSKVSSILTGFVTRDGDEEVHPIRIWSVYLGGGFVICVAVYLLFAYVAFFKRFELQALDLRYRRRPRIHESPRLGTIDIGPAEINRAGSWPISRRFYAEMMYVLENYGATLMSFDMFFPDPSPLFVTKDQLRRTKKFVDDQDTDSAGRLLSDMSVGADDELMASMKETRIAVLGQTVVWAPRGMFSSAEELSGRTRRQFDAMPDRHKKSVEIAEKFSVPFDAGDLDKGVARAYAIEPPDPRLLAEAVGVGFAQILPDSDGTVRKYPLLIQYDGRWYPSLALMGMSIITGVQLKDMEIVPGKQVVIPRARVSGADGRPDVVDIKIPTDHYQRMIVNWASDYLDEGFVHIPGTFLLYLRGVDLMRQAFHRCADKSDEALAGALATVLQQVGEKGLMDEDESNAILRELLLAHQAQTLQAGGEMMRDQFVAARADEDDLDDQAAVRNIWEQIRWNPRILAILRADPTRTFDQLKKTLALPDGSENDLRHSTEMLRLILRNGKDPNRWRPFYFFPPRHEVSLGGGRTMLLSPLDLEDKIFYVGLTATGTHDFNPMPFSARYPMVGLHANAANTILTRQFIHAVPNWACFLIILGCVFPTVLLAPRLHPIAGAAFMVVVIAAHVLACGQLFNRSGLWVPMMAPVSGVAVAYLAIIVHKFLVEQVAKRKVRSAFSTYMTPSVVNQVLRNPDMLRLGGERRVMTVYFSDLTGFTAISERSSPEELVTLLNEYFEGMTSVIFKYGGTLDKFEGDAVMAFWGAPTPQEDHPYLCCCAALDSLAYLENVLQPKWLAEGKPRLTMRTGINTGTMIVGNMGSRTRMDYTVMGDSVNLAARLEAANKDYGTWIMMSEFTREQVVGRIESRELDLLRVKGKQKAVRVYQVLARDGEMTQETEELVDLYNQGLKLYREREWEAGIDAFQKALAVDNTDGPTKTYLERCRAYLDDPPPADWDGVWVLTTK